MATKLSVFAAKVIEAGWLAAVVSVPLFFNIYTARTFEPDKITLMRSIVTVMVLAWLIKLLEEGGRLGAGEGRRPPWRQRLGQFLRSPMALPVAFIVLAYIISTLFSISPQVSLWGSYQRLQGTYTFVSYVIIFALMALNMRRREQVERFVNIVILASVPVGLYGIVQRYGLDPLPWAGNVTSRVASNMGNSIFVASYLIMIVPLTVSRLVESMTAIINEEKASWGHTILSAVYIFVLAVQVLTILFSQSRGPLLGLLGGFALMGLLVLMVLRHRDADRSRLSIVEGARGIVLAVGLILFGGIGGGLGFAAGSGLERLFAALRYQVDALPLLGAALGAMIGAVGLYTFLAASGRGWRWMWFSWPALALGAVVFVIFFNLLNFPGSPLEPLYRVPYLSRLGEITQTDSGTGRVRVLIWESALRLVAPHKPLGVSPDFEDKFNALRPLIGYGPEGMFNAFAYVYPPDLAHIEARGSSADRSHNETMDSLVMTGLLGFAGFYFLMVSLLYYFLKWLGWLPDRAARWRLFVLLGLGGLAGILIPYGLDGGLTFALLGLPFGLIAAVFLYLCIQGFAGQQVSTTAATLPEHPLLLIGLFGALIGHFIEVHFVFSIAATYTYFWAYLGLVVALARMRALEVAAQEEQAALAGEAEGAEVVSRQKTRRGRRKQKRRGGPGWRKPRFVPEEWDTWLSAQGLAMAIIMIILIFDFVPPNFDWATGRYSLLWMSTITLMVGLAIALSEVAVQRSRWRQPISWPWALILYGVTSLGYIMIYVVFHRLQLSPRNLVLQTAEDVLTAANVLTNGLLLFYSFLFILLFLLALLLTWRQVRGLSLWRAANWLVYIPLIAAAALVIWFKNIDVVRADIYLKEGERYRNEGQYPFAIRLHEEGTRIDSDEDFHYLMLALDYQLMAQDQRVDPDAARNAWFQGEKIALKARDINKFNPDNSGNMGRYYFTMGQVLGDPQWYAKAIEYFEKVTHLAPQNVQYYNLWAQTLYVVGTQGGAADICQDPAACYQEALAQIERSLSYDDRFAPTWLLQGDIYAAMGDVDSALAAHSQAIRLSPGDFADQFFDQRLGLYISAGRTEALLEAFAGRAAARPEESFTRWAMCRIYLRAGDHQNAVNQCEQALALGEERLEAYLDLADSYLAQGQLEGAALNYQRALARNDNIPQAHSALAYVYAQQGLLPDAVRENQRVLEMLPNDYDSHKNLAILYQQSGDLQQALAEAQQAAQLAPESEKASWATVIANLEAALAQSPESPGQ